MAYVFPGKSRIDEIADTGVGAGGRFTAGAVGSVQAARSSAASSARSRVMDEHWQDPMTRACPNPDPISAPLVPHMPGHRALTLPAGRLRVPHRGVTHQRIVQLRVRTPGVQVLPGLVARAAVLRVRGGSAHLTDAAPALDREVH